MEARDSAVRVAAVGDLHIGDRDVGRLSPGLVGIARHADLLVLAGDLTRVGDEHEAEVFANELAHVSIPMIAVLGNHDHHRGRPDLVADWCARAGIAVLEGDSVVVDVDGLTVGIAGTKGFGGGFTGASLSAFGEDQMKSFVHHSTALADALGESLARLDTDVRIALLHYAPDRSTVVGEPLEIYPFLGSGLLGEAIDRAGADLVVHGHAHHGTEKGQTVGGTPVRNVAQPLIDACYRVYRLPPRSADERPSVVDSDLLG